MTQTAAEAPKAAEHPRPRWRMPWLAFIVSVVCLAGVLVLLFPATADWFNNISQSQQISKYGNDVKEVGPAGRLEVLKQARQYNADLVTGEIGVKANQRKPVALGTKLPTEFNYDQLLDAGPGGLMARITIPSIHVDLPIYHGTSDAVLAQGVGHLEGTALPVGGVGTHAVLAGHRGLATSTLFTNLNEVKNGDKINIYVFGETLNYKVTSVKVVDPDQTKYLAPVPGKDLITLVTCTPIGINSQRILVTGERVLPTPAKDVAAGKQAPPGPGFPWWAAGIVGALALVTAYIWWSGRPARRRLH